MLRYEDEQVTCTMEIQQGDGATVTITERATGQTARARIPWADLETLAAVGDEFTSWDQPKEGQEYRVTVGAAPFMPDADIPTPTLMIGVMEWGDVVAFLTVEAVRKAMAG